jgi:hypothetical protein
MPNGDVRYRSGRGGYGGGSSYSYDDEGRGSSKSAWEWFESNYTASGLADSWLMSLSDDQCYYLLKHSTMRFNLEDIANVYDPDQYEPERWLMYVQASDSRARRMIKAKSPRKDGIWVEFYTHLVKGYINKKLVLEQVQRKRDEEYNQRWEKERKAREAEVAKLNREAADTVNKNVELVTGAIASDFATAFDVFELSGRDAGDYLDDVVDGYTTGYGFSEEVRRPGGVKLQITLTLDCTNSMYYNGVHMDAAIAFRDMGLTLKQLHAEHPNDLYVAFFKFGLNQGSEDSEIGKRAERLRLSPYYDPEKDAENGLALAEFSEFHPRYLGSGNSIFSGEDTWIYPLFEQIERWEKEESEPGCARLDIVLTDAVLEHPSDIRKADEIQERRNGNLQTVMLNFMRENEWSDGTLPKRCVQYPANRDTLPGLLRQIISEFITSSM